MEIRKAPTAVICLSPYSGGMELDSIKMAKKIAPFCKTVLIAQKEHYIAQKTSNDNSVQLETIKFNSSFGPAIIFGVRKLIKKHAIKNIIFFGASELKSLYFSFLGLDINLIIRHGTTKSRPKKDWFHRLIYSKVNYHVAICEHLANNVKYIIPFGKHTKLKTIYSSILINNKPQPRVYKDPIQIVNISRIAKGKGHEDVINSCETLYKDKIDFRLTLVGDGDEHYVDSIKTLVLSKPYKRNIVFAGRSDDIAAYLNSSDIFLFPSEGEGLSNAFIEGLSYGLVCLAYDNTSFSEFKELGFHCHLAHNMDIQDLQKKLLAISKDILSEKIKASRNIEISRQVFDPKVEINSYLSILI